MEADTKIVKSNTGRPTKCSKELAGRIIEQVATTSEPISRIAEANGVCEKTLYNWLSNEEFQQAFIRAHELRAVVRFASLPDKQAKLMEYIHASEDDPRIKDLHIRAERLGFERDRFLIEQGNPRLFSPKKRIESHVTVSVSEMREAAWASVRDGMADGEFEEYSE